MKSQMALWVACISVDDMTVTQFLVSTVTRRNLWHFDRFDAIKLHAFVPMCHVSHGVRRLWVSICVRPSFYSESEWADVWGGVLQSVVSSPSGVRTRARNAFWRILEVTESSFLHLYADALSSSNCVLCHILGAREMLGGNFPCPNVEPLLCVVRLLCSICASCLWQNTA